MSFHLSPLGRVAKDLQRFIFGLSRSVNFTDGRYLAALGSQITRDLQSAIVKCAKPIADETLADRSRVGRLESVERLRDLSSGAAALV